MLLTLCAGPVLGVPRGPQPNVNEAGTTLPTDRWYGSEKVADKWLDAVTRSFAWADE